MPGPLPVTFRSLSTGRSSYLPVHTPTHQHGRQQCSETAPAEVTNNSSAECAKQTSSTSHRHDAEASAYNEMVHLPRRNHVDPRNPPPLLHAEPIRQLMKWHASTQYRRGEQRPARLYSPKSHKTAHHSDYRAVGASDAEQTPHKRGHSAASLNFNNTPAPYSQR